MYFLTKEEDLNLNHKASCIYFYASWMPFNKRMISLLEKVEEKYKDKDIVFYAIDVDFFKNLCKRFEVDAIPAIVVNKDSKLVKKINGVIMNSALKKIFVDIFK
jgi:thiol-disulfide isomerase/thioredoxin